MSERPPHSRTVGHGRAGRGRIVGLDVGGSKTHAVLADPSGPLAEVVVGSANIASVGVREATRQLAGALDQLGAGDGRRGLRRGRRGRLARAARPARRAARRTAAHGDRPGGARRAAAAGRGRAGHRDRTDLRHRLGGLGRHARRAHARAGGWGYLLGDEGSGYGVTRAAVRHALGLLDRATPADRLTAALVAGCGLIGPEHLQERFYANPERRYWARQAGVVFELAADGDPAAARIVEQAGTELAALVRTVAGVLASSGPLVCAGGLITHQPALLTRLRHELAADGITDIRLLDRDPVHGAVRLATQRQENASR